MTVKEGEVGGLIACSVVFVIVVFKPDTASSNLCSPYGLAPYLLAAQDIISRSSVGAADSLDPPSPKLPSAPPNSMAFHPGQP